jgi:N-acetyl sugar amidotransferase
MDTSDPDISFNDEGVCNHATYFDNVISPQWMPNEKGKEILDTQVEKIREEGKNKEYDSIIGLSGGVDSSYLAYRVRELGLRPLVVHIDCGWNSEIASQNIENIVKKLDFDLHTTVINWQEMRDLQRSFFKSGVANQDTPQDHAIFAGLYRYATQNNIRYVISGSNYATESVLPKSWGYNAMDLKQLRAIHKKFGVIKLKTYPTSAFWQYYFYYPFIKNMRVLKPLNFMTYKKEKALKILTEELGWKYYGEKHHESRFTKFFQAHYLPHKFGYDKKRAHLSSLILSGQMTRDEALIEMEKKVYTDHQRVEDQNYIAKKLSFSPNEFQNIIDAPNKTFEDYPNNEKYFLLKNKIKNIIKNNLSR